ncbi:MAG: hypothetical protein WC861_05970 [Candidatus Micrarchaeia archaeon]|jgi:hypothetical protein
MASAYLSRGFQAFKDKEHANFFLLKQGVISCEKIRREWKLFRETVNDAGAKHTPFRVVLAEKAPFDLTEHFGAVVNFGDLKTKKSTVTYEVSGFYDDNHSAQKGLDFRVDVAINLIIGAVAESACKSPLLSRALLAFLQSEVKNGRVSPEIGIAVLGHFGKHLDHPAPYAKAAEWALSAGLPKEAYDNYVEAASRSKSLAEMLAAVERFKQVYAGNPGVVEPTLHEYYVRNYSPPASEGRFRSGAPEDLI